MSTLILVRHGETLGESSIRLNGVTDVALSPLGEAQMTAAAQALAGESFERVLISPLRRSAESAALIRPQIPPTLVPGFREIDFGHWETWTWAEVAERDPHGHAAWSASVGDFAFPGGESRVGFRRRVATAANQHLHNGAGPTLAVLHKGVIKVVLATLLGDMARWAAAPCELGSIHRLRREDGTWRLLSTNEIAHLGDTRSHGSH